VRFISQALRDRLIYSRVWQHERLLPPTADVRLMLQLLAERFYDEPLRVLDLGCGNGRNAIFLASHGVHVDAVDWDDNAIRALKAHALKIGEASPLIVSHLVNADVVLQGSAPGRFHGCVMTDVVHHLADERHEIEAILRTAGTMVLPQGCITVTVLADIRYSAGPRPRERFITSRSEAESLLTRVFDGWAIRSLHAKSVHVVNSWNCDDDTGEIVPCEYRAVRVAMTALKPTTVGREDPATE
jgi:2-polyprenyl-3-methyl-5-hydroxy-6-metoxy-1,4-benzoquinol methylase